MEKSGPNVKISRTNCVNSELVSLESMLYETAGNKGQSNGS